MPFLHEYADAIDKVAVDPVFSRSRADALALIREAVVTSQRIFFIGNGGSATIASHMAADWGRMLRCRTMCFNDPASLTMWGNDVGFDSVFTSPLLINGAPGDLLIAISSSGQSGNIVGAVHTFRGHVGYTKKSKAITLSGFSPTNPLRASGDVNLYVPVHDYGLVEVAHTAILHSILDDLRKGVT